LRGLRFDVHTFWVRRPPHAARLNREIGAERVATEDLLDAGWGALFGSTVWLAVSEPRKFMRAFRLAMHIGSPGLRGRLWPLAYLIEACLLARRLGKIGAQHLHNHIGRNSAAVAMLASTLSEIPFSLTIHGPTEFDMPHTLALNEKIRRARFTIAISEFGRSQLMRWSDPRDWPRIHVIRCGVGDAFLSDDDSSPVPDVNRIVAVGRLVEQKGHLLLIDAIARLVSNGIDVQLDLIGDGPLRSAIQSSIARHGLSDEVRLLGWRTSDEVRSAIEQSRALVLPSFAEGLPVVLMEAMALGRPVVASRIAGIPELIEDRISGWLVSPGNADELADALRELLLTPVPRLSQMGRRGRERVRRQHNAAEEASKLAALIDSKEDQSRGFV
jgi:colanic acid/amylovoran biosynthesis glycosyltransferase